jgi:hypothetical protein
MKVRHNNGVVTVVAVHPAGLSCSAGTFLTDGDK